MAVSVGSGDSGGISRPRNRPLRSRSVRMMLLRPGGIAASPANGTIATGMRCAPAPVISIESCAPAGAIHKARSVAAMGSERRYRASSGCSFPARAMLFVLRPEVKFQLAIEQAWIFGLGKRRGLQDRAVHRLVVAGVAARFALFHRQYLARGQQRDVEYRLRIAGQIARQDDVAADLGADLLLPGGERFRARVRLLAGDQLAQLAFLAQLVGGAPLVLDRLLLQRHLLAQPLLEFPVALRLGLGLRFRLGFLDGDNVGF